MPYRLSFALGLILSLLLTLLSYGANSLFPILGGAGWAIVIGLVFSPVLSRFKSISPSVKWIEKNILQAAIALMGTQLLWVQVLESKYYFAFLAIVGVILMYLGLKILPKFGISKELSWFLAGGEAVCGSAAIGAASGLTKAKSSEIALAILLVNGLSTIALFTTPILLNSLTLESEWNAWFTGGYIQSAGHAIAASFGVDETTGILGTAFKMGRIFLLIPLMLATRLIFKVDGADNKARSIQLPWFLYAFLLGFLSFNFIPAFYDLRDYTKYVGDFLLNWALVAIGLHISLKGMMTQGKSAVVAASLLTLFHLALLLFVFLLA